MKVRDLIKQLEQDGWYVDRTRGSHRQFKHLTKTGLVTVHGHPSDDVPVGTLHNIFKQAQMGDTR
ncbi:MAG: type II toxin-antitoxin system HicA family toxin [Armatimonadota bacterium]